MHISIYAYIYICIYVYTGYAWRCVLKALILMSVDEVNVLRYTRGLQLALPFLTGYEAYVIDQVQCLGYFIVGLFCYICSFLLFVWLFFFTYALLAVVYVSHVEDRFFNTPRL
jgi:hypothetical protein